MYSRTGHLGLQFIVANIMSASCAASIRFWSVCNAWYADRSAELAQANISVLVDCSFRLRTNLYNRCRRCSMKRGTISSKSSTAFVATPSNDSAGLAINDTISISACISCPGAPNPNSRMKFSTADSCII